VVATDKAMIASSVIVVDAFVPVVTLTKTYTEVADLDCRTFEPVDGIGFIQAMKKSLLLQFYNQMQYMFLHHQFRPFRATKLEFE